MFLLVWLFLLFLWCYTFIFRLVDEVIASACVKQKVCQDADSCIKFLPGTMACGSSAANNRTRGDVL